MNFFYFVVQKKFKKCYYNDCCVCNPCGRNGCFTCFPDDMCRYDEKEICTNSKRRKIKYRMVKIHAIK